MHGRLIPIPLVMMMVALSGCSSSGGTIPVSTAKPVLSLSAIPITVTTGADCQAPAVGHPFETFPLAVSDNGRTYRLVRCQALGVLLLHGGNDGCRWTTVESSDEAVLALAPSPVPAPPIGATHEDYRAKARASHLELRSGLSEWNRYAVGSAGYCRSLIRRVGQGTLADTRLTDSPVGRQGA